MEPATFFGLTLPLEIHDKQIIIQIIGFIILFVVLRKFLWKPILSLMEQREKEVKGIYDTAEEIRKKQEDLKADYESRIARIDEEGQKRLAAAMKKGQEMGAEIIEESRKEAAKEREKAMNTIREEVKKARVELRDFTVRMAYEMAEKVLHREVTRSAHDDLVNKFVDEIGQMEPGGRA
ncbi:MAG: F0F1 ATP synthase subunit B [bacterium]